MVDSSGFVRWVNSGFERFWQLGASPCIGKHFTDLLVGPVQQPQILHKLMAGLKSCQAFTLVFDVHTVDPASPTVVCLFEPGINQSGEHSGWFATISPVAQPVSSHQVRLDVHQELEHVQAIGKIGTWTWHVEGDYATWSPSLFQIYGMDPTSAVPTRAERLALYTNDSTEKIRLAITETLTLGLPFQVDIEFIRKDGSHGFGVAHGEAVWDDNKTILGINGTIQDVTDRYLIEI